MGRIVEMKKRDRNKGNVKRPFVPASPWAVISKPTQILNVDSTRMIRAGMLLSIGEHGQMYRVVKINSPIKMTVEMQGPAWDGIAPRAP